MINVGAELDSVDIFIQHSVDAQIIGDDAFLGPAFVSSNFDGLEAPAALTPTLLGKIAEGIALTSI